MHHKVATPPALLFRGGGALRGFLCQADWLRSVRLTVRVSASRAVRCTSTATIMVPGSRKWAKSYRQIRYFTHAPISFQVRGRHFCNYFLSPCLSVGTGAVSKKCGNSAECYSAVGTIPQAALLQNEEKGREKNEIVCLPLFRIDTRKGELPATLPPHRQPPHHY